MKGRAGSALNLIAALAVVFAGLAVPAGATVPGTNGKIAFTSTVPAFNEEIFIVNPAVSGYSETNLTNHPDDDTQPAWSPDGQKIAFISNRDLYPLDQYPDLWIMNGDGSGLLKLTPDASGVSRVEWFPDGSRILFYASCGDSHPLCGWFTVSPEGGDITPFAACAMRISSPTRSGCGLGCSSICTCGSTHHSSSPSVRFTSKAVWVIAPGLGTTARSVSIRCTNGAPRFATP